MQIASVDLFSFFNLLLGFLMGDCGTRNGCRMLMSQYVSDSQAQTHKPPSCVNQKLQEHMFLSIKQSSEMMELSSNLVSNNYFVTTFGNMNMENQKRILKIGHFSWHKTTQLMIYLTSFHLRLQEGRIVSILGIQCMGCENLVGFFWIQW